MSKISKLFKSPKRFFKDLRVYRIFRNENYKDLFDMTVQNTDESKKLAVCIGFNPWKRDYFQEYIPDFNAVFVRGKTPSYKVLSALKSIKEDYTVFIWSYQEAKVIYAYLKKNGITIHRVEDGFIRSVGLGSNKTKPLSLIIDNDSLYFNPTTESNLEKIIFNRAQNYTTEQLQDSKELINTIVQNKFTKYNFISQASQDNIDVESLINCNKKTILVIGQVEDDMSIKFGYDGNITNLELLELAKEENENENILYKPHPDVLHGKRKNLTPLKEYMKLSTIVPETMSLHELISLSDHIYTITSLSGFEAILQNKKVTCLGTPFYAGWGLTDDRHTIPERRSEINLSLEQLVLASLIDYPNYILGDIEKTLSSIINRKYAFPYDFYEKNIFLNLEGNRLDFKNIADEFDLKNKNIALVTENSNIENLYLGLNAISKEAQVFSTTLNVDSIIRTKGVINPDKCQFLVKAYLEPMGKIENNAIDLSKMVTNTLKKIITNMFGGVWSEDVANKLSTIVSNDLEDKLFNDCVKFYALQQLIEDFDYVVFHYNDETSTADYFRLLNDNVNKDKVIVHSFATRANLEILQKKLTKKFVSTAKDLYRSTNTLEDNIRLTFRKNWNKRRYDQELKQINADKYIMVCANLLNRNYAYYPSAEEIFKIAQEYKKSILLLPATNLNQIRYGEYKQILFEDTNAKINTDIYPSIISGTKEANKQLGNVISSSIIPKIMQILGIQLSKKLTNELYSYLVPKIDRNIDDVAHHIAYYFEMLKLLEQTKIYITTMERSVNSRLATLAAQEHDIKTFGIQPQVISISKRYRKPMVDSMLVIDPLQEENFIKLGYDKNKILKVGSANLRKHIRLLKDAEDIELSLKNRNSILFIMQHSMPEAMMQAIDAMKSLNEKEFDIYLKPHPHQEKQVLSITENSIAKHSNITLLDTDSDTYLYMKNSDITVGLFSSALYEAILFDKDVIVLKLDELDTSIDFSRFNTCAQAEDIDQLNMWINAFNKSTEIAQDIRKTRKEYIVDNKYIYSTDSIVNAIEISSIDKDN